MLDQGRQTTRLSGEEFIDMGAYPVTQDNSLVECLELYLVHCRNGSLKLENSDEMEMLKFLRRKG